MKKRRKKNGVTPPVNTSRCKAPKNVCIQQEVNTTVQLALRRESCVITLGKLLLFSTESGDAWLLEPAEGQSLCLARDGEKQPAVISEISGGYGVEWNSGYRIKGSVFMAANLDGEVDSIMGYPIQEIEAAIRRINGGNTSGAVTVSAGDTVNH